MLVTRLCARCLTDWPASRLVRYVDRLVCELCIRVLTYPSRRAR